MLESDFMLDLGLVNKMAWTSASRYVQVLILWVSLKCDTRCYSRVGIIICKNMKAQLEKSHGATPPVPLAHARTIRAR